MTRPVVIRINLHQNNFVRVKLQMESWDNEPYLLPTVILLRPTITERKHCAFNNILIPSSSFNNAAPVEEVTGNKL